MPFLAGLVPLLTSIGSGFAAAAPAIGAATGLAGLGLNLAETAGAPGAPTIPGPTPPTAQQLLQQRSAVTQALPNVLSATSGLANPAYDSLIAQILAGTIGQPGSTAAGAAATGQSFAPGTGQSFSVANSQPTNAAVTGNDIGLSNYIQAGT